jgi:uncharacterized membrane protein YtjA (UPF0391 family)
MRAATVILCAITVLTALVAFGGVVGPARAIARILFPIFLLLFLGSFAAPGFRAHH